MHILGSKDETERREYNAVRNRTVGSSARQYECNVTSKIPSGQLREQKYKIWVKKKEVY